MRVFKKYMPKQIAKYVVAFFKGKFVLEGEGVFVFDCGKVVSSVTVNKNAFKIIKEINECVGQLSYRIDVKQYT